MNEPDLPWSLWRRLIFRYWFSYAFLYLFPFPLIHIPIVNWLTMPWEMLARAAVTFMATYCFQVQPDWSSFDSGSGDQLIRWIELATYAALALPIAAFWSALDRKRRSYTFLFALLRIWALLFISSNMLSYGAAKIFPSQFPPLRDYVLDQTVGTKSPMGILWTFMSASQPYTIFAGLTEFLAGLLLAIPATRVLGTLVSVAVAVQIVMLNMSYDVPVKILSGHLLLLSLFLLLPDAKNLFDIFCRGKAGTAFPTLDLFQLKKSNRILWGLVWVFLIYYAGASFVSSYNSFKSTSVRSSKSGGTRGFWYVDSYKNSGPSTSPDQPWQTLMVYKNRIDVRGDGKWRSLNCSRDSNGIDFDLVAIDDPSWKAHFASQKPDAETWILRGEVCGTPCEMHLHRTKRSQYLLLNRGFHWVNEVPYNR